MSEEHVVEQLLSEAKPIQTLKLLELVEELRMISEIETEFNFSILIEQNPKVREYTYVCKVLAIIMKENVKGSKPKFVHYDEIVKLGLNYIEVKKKWNQKIGIKTPSFIDGSSVVKEYKGNHFIEFNIRLPNKRDMQAVELIRKKYNIAAPYVFKSENLHFNEI